MNASQYRRILGVDFFAGSARQAVDLMTAHGGLLVVPAAPALKDIGRNAAYRKALLESDLCIADSAFMTWTWNHLEGDRLTRLSGLEYLRELLARPELHDEGATFWVMPSRQSAQRNLKWLATEGIQVPDSHVYIAPMYGPEVSDPALLAIIDRLQPRHVVMTVGGGTQERLGLYIKQHIGYRPAIHCIGAAIAFLSGDQVQIPVWADKSGLGWLFRCLSEPGRYVPRYWSARKLYSLMRRYRSRLPVLES